MTSLHVICDWGPSIKNSGYAFVVHKDAFAVENDVLICAGVITDCNAFFSISERVIRNILLFFVLLMR